MTSEIGLGLLYLASASVIISAIVASARQGFSFHLLFSLLYFVTFWAGYPLSLALHFGFDAPLAAAGVRAKALLWATIGYGGYWSIYRWRCPTQPKQTVQAVDFPQHFATLATSVIFAKKLGYLTACLLALISLASLGYFIFANGWLLFRLEKYSQIFSAQVNAVALKRFFYFGLVALLLLYFLKPNRLRWGLVLLAGVALGALSYVAVGGTRANMALAVAFFVLIGLERRYFSWRALLAAAVVGVAAMFWLALKRYGLDVQGSEALFTFLYLTRDTFSPWENFARILQSPIEFQGLMPIVRDFYVYIPQSWWQERPEIVWNSANYFTKIVLENRSGLAISPTLLGAFYIMGGYSLLVSGMVVLGSVLRRLDWLWQQRSPFSALCKAYCLGNLFNLIVLVREGADAFVSRLVFFSVVFGLCVVLSYGFIRLFCQKERNEKSRHSGH